jgi:hypothetical protein
MAAIALTIIILLNYLAFYYAYGAFKGSVGTKKRDFFPAKNPVDARREVVRGILLAFFHELVRVNCQIDRRKGHHKIAL